MTSAKENKAKQQKKTNVSVCSRHFGQHSENTREMGELESAWILELAK